VIGDGRQVHLETRGGIQFVDRREMPPKDSWHKQLALSGHPETRESRR